LPGLRASINQQNSMDFRSKQVKPHLLVLRSARRSVLACVVVLRVWECGCVCMSYVSVFIIPGRRLPPRPSPDIGGAAVSWWRQQ